MTDDTVTAKLAEWEALTEAATEGPWHLDADGDAGVYTEPRVSQTSRDIASAWRREDEALIAASRTAMPALLGFVEDVLRLADEADAAARGHEPHRPCEAFARKVLADRMRAALTKRIGSEG